MRITSLSLVGKGGQGDTSVSGRGTDIPISEQPLRRQNVLGPSLVWGTGNPFSPTA